MPVYNCEKYVAEAIESILCQTFKDFEFLIINDGSSDKSEDIILSYKDSRIRYIKNEKNLKLISTLNKGLLLAQGEYIARMDSDDISLPNRLQEQLNYMESNSDVVAVGTYAEFFGACKSRIKSVRTESDDISAELLFSCPIIHPSAMIRRETLASHNIEYRMDYPHAEDYKFWAELNTLGKLANIPKVLLKYRISENQISNVFSETQHQKSRLIRRELLDYYVRKYDLDVVIPENFTYNHLRKTKELEAYFLDNYGNKELSSKFIIEFFRNLRLCIYLSMQRYSFKSLASLFMSREFLCFKQKEIARVVIKHFKPSKWENWI